jgi:hypothetical protein
VAKNFQKISSGITLAPLSTAPTSLVDGDIWYDSVSGTFKSRAGGITSGLGAVSIGGTITGATAGSVLFAGAAGILAQDNAKFFWDDTNFRLGIGTAAPSSGIDIVMAAADASTAIKIDRTASGSGTGIGLEIKNTATTSNGKLINAIQSGAVGAGMSLSIANVSNSRGALEVGTTGTGQAVLATTSGNGAAILGNASAGTGTGIAAYTSSATGRAFAIGSATTGSIVGISAQRTPAFTSYDLILPNAQGAAGTTLSNNGSGLLTWVAPMSIGGSVTSATAGSIFFAGTSGVLQQDNANLFWDDTNNRLGIGTTAPGAKLQIDANDGDDMLLLKSSTGSSNKLQVNYDGFALNFIANGEYVQFYGSAGFIFANPITTYQGPAVNKGTQAASIMIDGGQYATAGNTLTNSNVIMNSFAWNGSDGYSIQTQLDALKLTQLSATTNDARLDIGPSIHMLTVGGNVGIGTTTPAEKLDVSGNIQIPATTATDGQIKQNGVTLLHTYGTSSIFVGNSAGDLTSTGDGHNVGIGYLNMGGITTAAHNASVGSLAGPYQGGNNNAILGAEAAGGLTGNSNVAIGFRSMQNVGTVYSNIAIGQSAFRDGGSSSNIMIGQDTGALLTGGSGSNTFIGSNTGGGITTGSYNTILGASVNGLSDPSNNIILADGQGNIKARNDGTNWSITGHMAITTNSELRLNNTANTFYVAHKADSSLASTVTYTWPVDGTSGQILYTNGSGVLDWKNNTWNSSVKSANYTAVNNDELYVDTTGSAVTITLPATATIGHRVRVIDYIPGNWSSFNSVTVARNGNKIDADTSDFSTNGFEGEGFEFVYVNATVGWRNLAIKAT